VKRRNTQKKILKHLQTFINICLRKVFKIFLPNTISNEERWSLTHETTLEQQIKCRKWKWIGYTLRKHSTAIENQALNWNPQGQRRRGRPRTILKRTVVEEVGKAEKHGSKLEHYLRTECAGTALLKPNAPQRSNRIDDCQCFK
jgi:hypothetical protein